MGKITLRCPKCGTELSAPEDKAGTMAKCPKCGSLVQVPLGAAEPPTNGAEEEVAAEEAAAPRGAVGLRVRLVFNALRRHPLTVYYLARSWGERYELWIRVLVCLLPFGVGGLVSWCLWLWLPDSTAFRGAIGVLLLTVACGLPLLVAFFPGSRAARAERSLARLRGSTENLRAELAGGRTRRTDARAARAMLRRERRAEAGRAVLQVPEGGPSYGVVRLFVGLAYILGAVQVALAIALVPVVVFTDLPVLMAIACIAGLAWTGLLLVFVGQLLALLLDAGRNLWRINETLGELRNHLAESRAETEAVEAEDGETPSGDSSTA